MTVLKVVVLFFVALAFSPVSAQVKIIFDTDFGGDADDLGALVMLHNFVDREECSLLGVMSCTDEQYSVSAIDAVNRFYNHPNIPVGVRKVEAKYLEWCYSKPIADKFKFELTHKNASDATVLYRQILARNSDTSIVIVTVGLLKNIENLLQSGPDSISNLTGRELVEKKVKEFVIMGGGFPGAKQEWNFYANMPGVTKYVIENLHVPIVFSGAEVGSVIQTGSVFNEIDHNTPLYVGFLHFSKNAPWVKSKFEGRILDNATFDQTAVLYAVRRDNSSYWAKPAGWYCTVDIDGSNEWVKQNDSNHTYLKLRMDKEEIATLIESIMLNDF